MNLNLIKRLHELLGSSYQDEKELLLRLKNLISDSDYQNLAPTESKDMSVLIQESLELLKNGVQEKNLIKTGFTDFDNTFGGFSYGEFIVIGARPAMGTTQLLVNLAIKISAKNPLLFFTFDLSDIALSSRFIANVTDISSHRILENKLYNSEKDKLALLTGMFDVHKVFVNDSVSNSVTALKMHCQKRIEEDNVKVIVVDCIQMMSSNRYRNNRELEIGYISRELKGIARDFNVCVIASSQLSRAVETRSYPNRPILTDLRESGAIEQNADKVIFLYRPDYYGAKTDGEGNNAAGIAELIIAKNRNGLLGAVKIKRNADFTNFHDFEDYEGDFSFDRNRLDELDEVF